MAFPSRNAILRGIFFVLTVLMYLLCERWMTRVKVQGTARYIPHAFDHPFLMWTFKQGLLASMYILWKAIHKNWLGMRRLRHAENDEETEPKRTGINSSLRRRTARHSSVNSDGDDEPLLSGDGQEGQTAPRPRFPMRREKSHTKLLFLLPSMFSASHILLAYFGLKLTYPSSVIMLKGTAAMFATLLSLAFLAKQISCAAWVGVSVTAAGFAISGLSDYINIKPAGYERYGIAAGDLLYTMGQITLTTQMVYEEKFMRKLSIHPMKFLGSEGIYSLFFALVMLASFCLSDTQYTDLPNNRIEDIADAALQFVHSWQVILAVIGSLISYVVMTYLGMILIKDHGAMARVMIEAIAWCFYWVIVVAAKWEQFYITQIPGLMLVPCGVIIFSNIISCPCIPNAQVLDPFRHTEEIGHPIEEELQSECDPQNAGPYRHYNGASVHGALASAGQPLDDQMLPG